MSLTGTRVLILDDDSEDVELVRDYLRDEVGDGVSLLWADTYEEGLRILGHEDVDACLVDYRLGARTGLDFLKEPQVRRSGVPVILMTGQGTPEVDRMAMDAGAADYLPKDDMTGAGLERTIRYAVERRRRHRVESRARALIGNVQEIVSILDPDGTLRYVSPSLTRILGREVPDEPGWDPMGDVHPDDRSRVRAALERVRERPEEKVTVQCRMLHGGGGWRVMETIAENHLDNPHIRGIVSSSRDVTDRVEREQRLRFQGRLLDAVGQAVVAVDLNGRVAYWNPAAERIFGWPAEEAQGQEIRDLAVAPADRDLADDLLQVVQEEGSWTGEAQVRRADGSTFVALMSNSLYFDPDGSPAGIIGVSSDITHLKETELALRERVKELRLLSRATEILSRTDSRVEDRLREVVELIPSGWLDPERTEARLTLPRGVIETEGFRDTPWRQSAEVHHRDGAGRLEVVLTERVRGPDRDPFLPEEQELLDNLSRIIGDALGRASLAGLLSQVLEAVHDAVLVIRENESGRGIQYANAAAARIFGYDEEELIGQSTEILRIDEAVFERFALEGEPALEEEGVYFTSVPLQRRDGTRFEAEQAVSLLDPARGLEGGVVSVVRDVSEQRRTQGALRESEERFRAIAEHIEDVFWITSPDKSVMEYISPAYETVWGRPVEEHSQNPGSWIETVIPADRARVQEALAAQARGPWKEEYRIVRPDGEERWILDRSFPVRGPSGEVERVIGVAKDITERKRLEARFGVLSREITDVIFVVSADGTVLTASPSVYQVAGYLRTEFEGTSALEIVHPDDREALAVALQEVTKQDDRTARIEHRIVTRSGDVRHVESIARNLLHDPAVEGILVTARDATERLALERRVRQMQKIESVGQLAGGIAHDFNNILTVIRSQTDLMLLDLPSGPLADEVGVIQSAADRAAMLTRQLLAFSRDQVLQPRVVDLAEVAREAGRLVERTIGEHIEIRYQLGGDLPPVRVDPNQIEQVILNLALNARDAMPGGGTLTIGVDTEVLEEGPPGEEGASGPEAEGEPGTFVVLWVADTGHGIDPEIRHRIFEPFFTTKPKGQGTGLGLSMVHGTVTQSGGTLDVESAPGKGTTFLLRFRAVQEREEGLPTSEGSQAPAAPEEAPAAGDTTILVIEDDPTVLRSVVRVLGQVGFQVLTSSDAEGAMRMLNEEAEVDLVLTDLGLPGVSGFELVDLLRQRRPELSLIVMSGYAEGSPGRDEGLPTDVAFLQKPFTPDELLEMVETVVRRS